MEDSEQTAPNEPGPPDHEAREHRRMREAREEMELEARRFAGAMKRCAWVLGLWILSVGISLAALMVHGKPSSFPRHGPWLGAAAVVGALLALALSVPMMMCMVDVLSLIWARWRRSR